MRSIWKRVWNVEMGWVCCVRNIRYDLNSSQWWLFFKVLTFLKTSNDLDQAVWHSTQTGQLFEEFITAPCSGVSRLYTKIITHRAELASSELPSEKTFIFTLSYCQATPPVSLQFTVHPHNVRAELYLLLSTCTQDICCVWTAVVWGVTCAHPALDALTM